jgi:hypothetical protein
MLEKEQPFDKGLAALLSSFFARLQEPICLLAHNGTRFDFPIFAREMGAFKEVNNTYIISVNYLIIFYFQLFPYNLLCCDSLVAFRELLGNTPIQTRTYVQQTGVKRRLEFTEEVQGGSRQTVEQ